MNKINNLFFENVWHLFLIQILYMHIRLIYNTMMLHLTTISINPGLMVELNSIPFCCEAKLLTTLSPSPILLIRPSRPSSNNSHSWTFFVQKLHHGQEVSAVISMSALQQAGAVFIIISLCWQLLFIYFIILCIFSNQICFPYIQLANCYSMGAGKQWHSNTTFQEWRSGHHFFFYCTKGHELDSKVQTASRTEITALYS